MPLLRFLLNSLLHAVLSLQEVLVNHIFLFLSNVLRRLPGAHGLLHLLYVWKLEEFGLGYVVVKYIPALEHWFVGNSNFIF